MIRRSEPRTLLPRLRLGDRWVRPRPLLRRRRAIPSTVGPQSRTHPESLRPPPGYPGIFHGMVVVSGGVANGHTYRTRTLPAPPGDAGGNRVTPFTNPLKLSALGGVCHTRARGARCKWHRDPERRKSKSATPETEERNRKTTSIQKQGSRTGPEHGSGHPLEGRSRGMRGQRCAAGARLAACSEALVPS